MTPPLPFVVILGSWHVEVGHSWCPWRDEGGEKTGQERSCCPPATFRTHPGTRDLLLSFSQRAPHWLAKWIQICTLESLTYKEKQRTRLGIPLQCPPVFYNDHWVPLWTPWTQKTRCWLCQSFVTTACRLLWVTREGRTVSSEAQPRPLGSAGRQCPKVERAKSATSAILACLSLTLIAH